MGKTASRKAFGEALSELGDKYKNVVCLDADLSKSTMSILFKNKYPERFFEMGIQEANMIGAATGMSFSGKIPFICSFAAFLTGRFDQIRISIAYANANVKLIGTHCGVGIGEDGYSQMGLEDLSIMRTLPNMVVLQPADAKETKEMIEWAIKHEGPVYLRLTRQGLKDMNMDKFERPGIFPELKKGQKVAFLACGGLLEYALEAAHNISKEGKIDPAVFNANCLNPIDNAFMSMLANNFDEFIVFEDHTVNGGTGGMVAEWMSENANRPKRVRRYGIKNIFGESGTPEDLYKFHGFTTPDIEKFVKKYLT